jgi:protein-disulfide isomerase
LSKIAMLALFLAAVQAAAPGPVPPEEMQGVSFDGLDGPNTAQAVSILNERGCDCGCGMKVAVCRRDDANCTRSRGLANQVVGLVKDGKTVGQIVEAVFSPPSKFVQFAIDPGDAPALGPTNAKVTIVHYVDYQCPFCGRAASTIDQILKDYPADVRVVFKMHPLPFHPNALPAAEAAMAAKAQGKFFEMHRKLFENQANLTRERILAIAAEIGLDVPRFTADLDSHAAQPAIAKETGEAEGIGASGTPASFVNGRFVNGAKPYAYFKDIIDEELAWAKAGNRPKFAAGTNVSQAAAPQTKPPGPDPTKVYDLPAGNAPSRGPADAKVTVLHYLDFQCPVCKVVAPTIDRIAEAYPDDVRVVYKMHPLSIHPQAMLAAEAALSAHAQGKFREMHDKLYLSQPDLSRERIVALAKEIGLDVPRFTNDLDTHAFRGAIEAETKDVVAIGSTATPTTFVNGRYLVGAQPFEIFKKVVDEELVRAKSKSVAAR